jgi:hypothetical protein
MYPPGAAIPYPGPDEPLGGRKVDSILADIPRGSITWRISVVYRRVDDTGIRSRVRSCLQNVCFDFVAIKIPVVVKCFSSYSSEFTSDQPVGATDAQ